MTRPLAPAFLAAHGVPPPPGAESAWEEALRRGVERARAAWPGVALSGERFAEHLARHLPTPGAPELLERLHLEDLYLACGCVEGVPAALADFEAHFLPEVGVAVARMKLTPTAVDELRQQVRLRMLVATPSTPARLATYPGTGPLAGWVRAAALWLARDLVRQHTSPAHAEDAALSLLVEPGDDPELACLKTRYRAEFNTAFAQALAHLSPRERNLLRLKYLDGLSVDALGALYAVHRATAARWVVSAQEALLTQTRRLLTEHLRLTGSQLDSVLHLISSQLDMSLGRLLRSRPE